MVRKSLLEHQSSEGTRKAPCRSDTLNNGNRTKTFQARQQKGSVDLDLDSLRIAIDPEEMDKANARRLMHNERFGIAVATVRKNNNLTQNEIEGLSDRQLRRIEKGEHATFKALEYLAAAHEMTLRDYLAAVAKEAQEQPINRSARSKIID